MPHQPSLIENSRPLAPHNRLGIDYAAVPPHKVAVPGGIVDVHTHCHGVEQTRVFLRAAKAYGITKVWTMAPLEDARPLREAFPGVFEFIAVPKWQSGAATEEFITDWQKRLDAFWELGARIFKLHMAPGTKKRWGMGFEHPLIRRVVGHAYKMGYHFMSHVGDPKAWFYGTGRYADRTVYGTFEEQFAPLERFLEKYPDRIHLGAHMGGSMEDLEALARRLERFPQYIIDSSATKWIVRAIAEQSVQGVKDFVMRFQDRILFGSDLVIGEKYDFDHYASRYWVHLKQWETDYRGQSSIEDPDAGRGFDPRTGLTHPGCADGITRITGLNLPEEVLVKLYRGNVERWLPRG